MEHVIEAPHRFPVERAPGVRRAALRRFPFKVIYRETDDGVQLLAVSHKRRRPDYWSTRV